MVTKPMIDYHTYYLIPNAQKQATTVFVCDPRLLHLNVYRGFLYILNTYKACFNQLG